MLRPPFLELQKTQVCSRRSRTRFTGSLRNTTCTSATPATCRCLLTRACTWCSRPPPYWTLKEYPERPGQLGHVADYDEFVAAIGQVWSACFRVLVPGGRIVCVVGDVLLSRRKNGGRHRVMPLHSSIQEQCRRIGFDNLAPIIWNKIGNAQYEAGGGRFLGKPFEPNAVVKNDIEYILFQRKPGGYRSPTVAERVLSVIPAKEHGDWFQQVWRGLGGASTARHPAPFPLALAERLVRMFSFVGDTVLDPFVGSGTTSLTAAAWGRNSVAIDIDPTYVKMIEERMHELCSDLFREASLHVHDKRESVRPRRSQAKRR